MIEFPLAVLYTQIQAFRAKLPRAGSLWTDDHVAQGFAWRPETVAFGVPDHDGQCVLQAAVADAPYSLADAVLWAVAVPFEVTTGKVSVGTVLNTRDLDVPVGRYSLVFEAWPGRERAGETYAFMLRLLFCPDAAPDFAILRKGEEITTDVVLRRDADPA
ncbi:hypothetical protein IP69_10665 [Bosea sp. AAP35]|uniref:competence protein ComJ n=1 Tax=Bosea sp. AAP35 TaxID=1523417 RepID=UPI0006B96308|nr:competence protein ComJ [Bosea sp. AAP35]KPF69553.1 hypothetical protein IP69_10665 [Bosea sp. AAP35]